EDMYDDAQSGPPDQAGASPAESYPRVSSLAKIILGQSFPDKPLRDRLAKMEAQAFGSPSTSDDLSARTDALEHYSEKKLHKKPLGAEQNKAVAGGSGGSGVARQVANM